MCIIELYLLNLITKKYKNQKKTLEVIETPKEIKNPEKIEIKPNGEAFDESVEVRLKDDPEVKETIEKALDTVVSKTKEVKVYPLDISLYIKGTDTKVQPNAGTSVTITCPIPESLLEDKDNVKVVCMIDGKLQILETKVVEIDGVYCARFVANHFSPYAIVVDKDDALSNISDDTTKDTADEKTDTNPITVNNSVLPISLIAILSATTFVIVKKKSKA